MSPTSQNPDDPQDAPESEFGPGGYVPPKAAARARKIVLREQMGLHWPIAAVVAGVLTLLVVVPFVLTSSREPQPPFVDVGPLSQIDSRSDGLVTVDGTSVLVVRGGGVLAAFAEPPESARYCVSSRRIESPAGGVWSLGGRPLGGDIEPLSSVPVVAYDDRLWIDQTSAEAAPAAPGGTVQPECG